MSLKDKEQFGCINHREGNVKDFFELKDVKEAVNEFRKELLEDLAANIEFSKENLDIFDKIFGDFEK